MTRRPRATTQRCAQRLLVACILVTLGVAPPRQLSAHGDAHEQIDALTRQIASGSRDAALFVKRGELHSLHRDWPAAQADFDQAARLDPNLAILDLLRGKLWLEADQPAAAKPCLDRFLARRPNHVAALVARARVCVKLGDATSATRDFSAAIARTTEPSPDFYLERARALMTDLAQYIEALRGLDEGIQKLGPIVALETLAIELEIGFKNYTAALARVAEISALSARQEIWLARRGEILLQAGRCAEARQAMAAARSAIESLPTHQRASAAMLQLETRVKQLSDSSTNCETEAGTKQTQPIPTQAAIREAAARGAE